MPSASLAAILGMLDRFDALGCNPDARRNDESAAQGGGHKRHRCGRPPILEAAKVMTAIAVAQATLAVVGAA
jgi:hypothetical protein